MNSTDTSFSDRCAALLADRPDLFTEAGPSPQTVQTGWWWAAPHVEKATQTHQRRPRRSRQLHLKLAA